MIAGQPHLIQDVDYVPATLKMLDYAISNWNTPKRDKALDILAQNEDAFNKHFGLEGIPENSDMEGIDNGWEELEGLSNADINDELNGKKKKKDKPAKKGFFTKVKDAVKKGGKDFIRYNPL